MRAIWRGHGGPYRRAARRRRGRSTQSPRRASLLPCQAPRVRKGQALSPHDGYADAPDPQGTVSPARYAQGTAGFAQAFRALEAERDNWRALAEDRGAKLDAMVSTIAGVRAELETFRALLAAMVEEHRAALAEHDRS